MILSRTAEASYWMCRYLERAENIARVIDVHDLLLIDRPDDEKSFWQILIRASGDEEIYYEQNQDVTREAVISFLSFDSANPNSIQQCILSARANALQIRDCLPNELWESINRCYWLVKERATQMENDDLNFLSKVRSFHREHLGIIDSSLSRDELWRFCRLGIAIERADKTSRILDVKAPDLDLQQGPLDPTHADVHAFALLRAVEGLHMYRKVHRTVRSAAVIEFLTQNELFPRSLAFCLGEAESALRGIMFDTRIVVPSLQKILELKEWLREPPRTLAWGRDLQRKMDELQQRLNHFGDALQKDFFTLERRTSDSERFLDAVSAHNA